MNPLVEALARLARMYTCKEMCELVTEDMDGALSLRRRAWVRAHLTVCPGCRRFRRQLALTTATLRAVANQDVGSVRHDAPAELKAALGARLRAKRESL